MLLVPTEIKPSPISGMGLFATTDIEKGEVIWKFDDRFDKAIDPRDVEQASEVVRDYIATYAYLSKVSGLYIVSLDNDRFTNHAVPANRACLFLPDEPEVIEIAAVDIGAGTELTNDYSEFDAEFALYADSLN